MGMLANRPMQNVVSAEIAAVAVVKGTLQIGEAELVFRIRVAQFRARGRADAGATCVCHDGRVDGDNVCHREECCKSSTDFGEEVCFWSLSGLFQC